MTVAVNILFGVAIDAVHSRFVVHIGWSLIVRVGEVFVRDVVVCVVSVECLTEKTGVGRVEPGPPLSRYPW